VKTTAKASDKITAQEKEDRKKFLPCFWIPNLTPDNGVVKLTKPESGLHDPFGNKLKLKKLVPIKYTLTTEVRFFYFGGVRVWCACVVCVSCACHVCACMCMYVHVCACMCMYVHVCACHNAKSGTWKHTRRGTKKRRECSSEPRLEGESAPGVRLLEAIDTPPAKVGGKITPAPGQSEDVHFLAKECLCVCICICASTRF